MNSLYEEDKQCILNTYKRVDIEIVRGEGTYLYDKDGNAYLDMYSGIAVNGLGHANPGILNVINEQASKCIHLSNYFASVPSTNLAKLLIQNSFASKVFFCNSGTEATEAAIKVVRKFGMAINEDKIQIVTAKNSFHGRSTGAVTLTGQEKYNKPFGPLLPSVSHFDFNDLQSLRNAVSDKTCALFIEIIQGEGGVYEVSDEFIKEIIELSSKYNFLVVVDEIQTGLSRTGDLFAYEKFGLVPDLVTLAKSLGGGIPIGALLVSPRLEEVLKPGDHGTTFGGNILAAAVGEYVLNTVASSDFKARVKAMSDYLINKLNELASIYPSIIKDVRGRGLMIGIDVGAFAEEIKSRAFAHNVLLNSTNGSVIRLLPALTISHTEIDEFLSVFSKVLLSLG